MAETWYFAWHQFRRMITSARFYVVIAILAAILWSFFGGVPAYLRLWEVRLQANELFILYTSSELSQRFLLFASLLLLGDAPFLREGLSYQLIRSNKRHWYLGQLLYCGMITVAYLLITYLLLLCFTGGNVSFENAWSLPFRQECSYVEQDIPSLEPLGIKMGVDFTGNFLLGKPYAMLGLSFLYSFFLILTTCIIGMILNLQFRTGVGMATAVVFAVARALGGKVPLLSSVINPISPCYLAAIGERQADLGTIGYTCVFFVCVILAFSVFSYHKIKRSDLQKEVHR